MTAVSNQVTIGTNAVVLVPQPKSTPTQDVPVILSNGAAVIFVGGPNVTAATGLPIPANTVVNLGPIRDALYAVCATSSVVGYLTTQ